MSYMKKKDKNQGSENSRSYYINDHHIDTVY